MMGKTKVERDWLAGGLRCQVRRMPPPFNHMCGYVQVPVSHPWNGVDYGDEVRGADVDLDTFDVDADTNFINVLMLAIADDRANVLRRIEWRVRVHGGVTFAGRLDGEDGWWFGFDCAHAGDDENPRWRAVDEVALETDRMAAQILAYSQVTA